MKGGKMKKDLNYYMSLDYGIEITPIPKDEGGGFVASIPQLGKYAFIGGGKTPIEALKDLEETKKEYFKEYIKKKIEIPEPEEPKREFRGDFLIRMPTFLHESLYAAAKKNEVSLNQYINYLLTTCMTLDSFEKKIEELSQEIKQLPEKISKAPEASSIEWRGQPSRVVSVVTDTADLGIPADFDNRFYSMRESSERKKKTDTLETFLQQEE